MHVLRNLIEGNPVHAYTDQYSTPTDADSLAKETALVIEERKEGILHLAGKETCSRYEYAKEIARLFGKGDVEPITIPDDGRPKRVGLVSHLPSWREGVERHISAFKENGPPKART